MSDKDRNWEDLNKGHIPRNNDKDYVQGGYQPETNEAGTPPTGGGGGKEPDKDD